MEMEMHFRIKEKRNMNQGAKPLWTGAVSVVTSLLPNI